MSTTTYTLENAKSGRSKCSKCKTPIAKGDLRVVYHNDDGSKVFTSSTKPECFKVPRKYNHLSMEEFVDEILIDGTQDKLLEDPTFRQNILDQLNMVPAKKKKKKEQDAAGDAAGGNFIQSAKRCAVLMSNEDEEKPAKKKVKLSDEDKALGEAYLKFKPMKTAQLDDILSWNNIVKTGTKDVKLIRVIDGYLNGRIAKCVVCGKGQPKVSEDGSNIICNGYYNSDIGMHLPCGTESKIKDVKRLPWFHQEPTDEEKEAIEKEEEESDKPNEQIPDAMMNAVNKLEWDLTNRAAKMKAAQEMFELCSSSTSPIDVPSNPKTKIEIGKIVVENQKKTASAVLQLIVDKYGFKEKNNEDAKKKSTNIASLVGNKANAAIFEAFSELSMLYFKEGNTNAGIAYRKASEAIRKIKFEITEDNAKGLGKGKTKVDNIGKSSADKIHEFVTTGSIQKLEEKRASA